MLTDAIQPPTLAPALKAVMRWLTSERIAGTIIGGVAASVRGKPRFTKDVNAVILADEMGWERAVDSAAQYGLVPRVENVLELAARSRVLLLHHDASGVEVDVSLGALPFERETIERSTIVRVGALRLRISSAEDLVIMKAVARRPKDVADIDSHSGCAARSRPRPHSHLPAGVLVRAGDAGDPGRLRTPLRRRQRRP